HTMVSVKWEPHRTKVSLHRMFQSAPDHVMQALGSYIRKEDKSISSEIREFIDKNLSRFDYSHLINTEELKDKGAVYDLKAIYDKINKMYFKSSLDLRITFFGNGSHKKRTRCTLGLYYDTLKLIKIHRLLDDYMIPEYVVEFVVFHEMLHAICPASIDEKGMYRVHGAQFKKLEERFYAYDKATEWLKKNQANFFLLRGVQKHGRTQQMGKYQASKEQSRCSQGQAVYPHLQRDHQRC